MPISKQTYINLHLILKYYKRVNSITKNHYSALKRDAFWKGGSHSPSVIKTCHFYCRTRPALDLKIDQKLPNPCIQWLASDTITTMASKKRKLISTDGSDESPIPKKAPRKTPKLAPKRKKSPKKHKSLKKLSDSAKKDFEIDSESDNDCLVIDECEGSSESASNAKESSELNVERCDSSDFPLWDFSEVLSETTGVRLQVAKNIVKLINEENTLPFIARYRKSMIDHMSPEKFVSFYSVYLIFFDILYTMVTGRLNGFKKIIIC